MLCQKCFSLGLNLGFLFPPNRVSPDTFSRISVDANPATRVTFGLVPLSPNWRQVKIDMFVKHNEPLSTFFYASVLSKESPSLTKSYGTRFFSPSSCIETTVLRLLNIPFLFRYMIHPPKTVKQQQARRMATATYTPAPAVVAAGTHRQLRRKVNYD